MSWLKKIGAAALKIIGIWPGIAPLVGKALPGVGEVTTIANVVISTEQMFAAAFGTDAKKGSDKLKAAVPFVAQVLQSSVVFQGKALKDEKLAAQAFTQITSAFADLLNAYGE